MSTTVTPAVDVDADCNITPVPIEGVTYSIVPSSDGTLVTAIPVDGLVLTPGAGWSYDPHAATLSTVIICEVAQPAPEPFDEETLPATGVDPVAQFVVGGVLVAVGATVAIANRRRREPGR